MLESIFDDEENPVWAQIPLSDGWMLSSIGELHNPSGEVVRTPDDGDSKGNVRISEYHASYNAPMDLVLALTFFEGYDKDFVISHIDGDPYNHAVGNLQFFDKNTRERIFYRPHGRKLILDRRLKGRVLVVETGMIFDSASQAADYVGGNRKDVHLCLTGVRRSHKGYHFKYA